MPGDRLSQACGQHFASPDTHAADEIIVAVDVAVERRLAHPEFGGEPRERQRGQSLSVDQLGGRRDDRLSI